MTLRLTESEQEALRARAEAVGISMQETARRAVREFVARGQHRDWVELAAQLIMTQHASRPQFGSTEAATPQA
jgi:plasmid stability protein